jgi:hypothetical protein
MKSMSRTEIRELKTERQELISVFSPRESALEAIWED